MNKHIRRNATRFDTLKKPSKEKWYTIVVYNGTNLLTRQVVAHKSKGRANNYAKDLIGKTYKGKIITSVVLDGPHNSMMTASNVVIIMPAPV